jgi:hypothetical protein
MAIAASWTLQPILANANILPHRAFRLQDDSFMPKSKSRGKDRRQGNTATVTIIAIVATCIVVGAYVLSLGGGSTVGETSPVPSAVLSQLSQVALARLGAPSTAGITPFNGTALSDGGKTVVLYISGDACPYCAAERWSLVIALMRFGSFSSLSYTYSGSNIEYPDTPSFSFANYSYSSQYFSLQAYEFEDRNGNPLMSVPANYTALWKGSPSFGTVPFLDIGNVYALRGTQFSPSLLAGLTQQQVVQSIVNDDSVSKAIMAAADGITSALCNVTHGNPGSVCGLIYPSATLNLITGSPRSTADAWATVQYTQTEWIRKTSAPTR